MVQPVSNLVHIHDRHLRDFRRVCNWRLTWIGGFLILFGVANLVNSILDERDRARAMPAPQPPNEAR